ncbi:MAG: amidohydrolase family protein [Myxococcales bacterium]|nr:amidohydrolase family protein [Myxococcales bacterium]
MRPTPPATPAAPSKPAAYAGDGERVVLVGGELHTGDGVIINNSVVELHGTFGVVARQGDAQLSGARVIDVTGKHLTPGFIAADTNLGLVEIDLEDSTRDDARAVGQPTVDLIRAAHDTSLAIHEDSSLIQIQAIEGVTSAAVTPSGGLIAGQVTWIDLLHGDAALVHKAGVAVRATLGRAYGGSRSATLSKLAETLSDARLYQTRKPAHERGESRELAAHHLDLEALAPVLRGQTPLALTAHRASDIRAALELARRYDLEIVIIGGTEAWKEAEALARARVPVILQPTQNLPGSLDKLGARLDAAALLDEAGVIVAITAGGAHNVRNLRQEAGVAVAHGLPWERALTAATLNVARAYRMDREYGSVTTGKVANLVVWSGDPLELSSQAERVFIRGRAIPMVSRQTLLRERYRDLSRFSP